SSDLRWPKAGPKDRPLSGIDSGELPTGEQSARLYLGCRLVFGQLLLEHLGEIDGIQHQGREAAIARGVSDDLACEREQQARAFYEKNGQHVFLRKSGNVGDAAIDEFNVKRHFLVEEGLAVSVEQTVDCFVRWRLALTLTLMAMPGALSRPRSEFGAPGLSKDRSFTYCAST